MRRTNLLRGDRVRNPVGTRNSFCRVFAVSNRISITLNCSYSRRFAIHFHACALTHFTAE